MTAMWLDDTETDDYGDDYGDAEGLYDEGEDLSEESRADRQRRARQARIALARRRQAQARARTRMTPVPAPASPRQAVAAIRTLDLENKVQEEAFRSAYSAQSRRMTRSEYATVASVVVNQAIESFAKDADGRLLALARVSPLLLLSPVSRGTGVEKLLRDPRVIGVAVVGGITLFGEGRKEISAARKIDIIAPSELSQGDTTDRLVADVFDGRGHPLDAEVTWKSDDESVALVDRTTGKINAKAPGVAVITATVGTVVRRTRLKVTAPPATAPPATAPPATAPPATAGRASAPSGNSS